MDEATRLLESGYRCTSNRHRTVVRLDRPDWKEAMGRAHTAGFSGDPEDNFREGMAWIDALGTGAADQYRRVYSQDRLTVSDGVLRAIKKQAHLYPDDYRDVIED